MGYNTEAHKNKKWNIIWIISASLVGIEAVAVITGWIFGIDQLTRFLSNQINMKFLSGVAFLLCSIALPFIAKAVRGEKEKSQLVISATAFLILLIMTTLFIGAVLNIQTGLENLFIQDLGSAKTVTPGSPAIPTMIGFIIFGITSIFALFDLKKIRGIILFSSIIISILGIVVLLGYIFSLPYLYFEFSPTMTPGSNKHGGIVFAVRNCAGRNK